MENILIFIIIALFNAFIGSKKEKKGSFLRDFDLDDVFENIRNKIENIDIKLQPQSVEIKNETYNEHKYEEKKEKLSDNFLEKVDKEHKKVIKNDYEDDTDDDTFDLFSDVEDIKRGLIMSEILSKPKSLR
ncbi:hypothetical protein [Alkalithermobacter paradoxus]|uniref:Uncharacterized protein n=1 Tax=Alkalithermobacter paradoxus TaxID=29349 RepID=A0A1V4IBG7_9FIRM|nr:hypothetical protein CLOTH_02670 [[Clostridium] thermoalcaliphilum]